MQKFQNQSIYQHKQSFYTVIHYNNIEMRKVSVNSFIKLISLRNSQIHPRNQIVSQQTQAYKISPFNSNFSIHKRNNISYYFSTNANKPPGNGPQKNDKSQQYSAKHRQMEQAEDFTQNAQMAPDGQKSEQNKDSPFIPTAFGNYVIAISAACLILAYAVMEVQFMRASNAKKSPAEGAKKVVAKGKAHIGGDWDLIGTDGKPVSNKDFQGKYYLIYFGFCNCPDICPNSLMKLAKALEKVKKTSDAKFFNIESVFVSVDPDRDTPEKIDKFAKYFDKTMIGVTGKSNDDPALKDCMRKFKIYSSKIEFQDEESVIKGRKSYTIDHTILTYLMNPQNEYVAHIGANLGEHDMAKLIMEKIKEDQRVSMQKLKV